MGGAHRTVGDKLKLLKMAKRIGVTKACREMGFSRDSCYRFRELYKLRGKAGLRPMSRRQPLFKLRVPPDVERRILEFTRQHPMWGRHAVAMELWRYISPSGVGNVWRRHGLTTLKDRLTRFPPSTPEARLAAPRRPPPPLTGGSLPM